jgi:hypothetical protein
MSDAMVQTKLVDIDPQRYRNFWLHGIREPLVEGMVDIIESDGYAFPPALVVEDECILDGHHRIESAGRAGVDAIPAYVIDADDFKTLVDREFGGDVPDRLADLDDYIVMPDGNIYDERAKKKSIEEKKS